MSKHIHIHTHDAIQQAYKGYLIKENPIRGEFYITKDGHHIGTAHSFEEAKKIIDQLVD